MLLNQIETEQGIDLTGCITTHRVRKALLSSGAYTGNENGRDRYHCHYQYVRNSKEVHEFNFFDEETEKWAVCQVFVWEKDGKLVADW